MNQNEEATRVYVPPGGPPQGSGPSSDIYARMGEEHIFAMCRDFYRELEQSEIRHMFPDDMPAVAVADGSITSSFLQLFGRSARATGMETERVNELASPQWLHMLNSGELQSKLQNGPKLRAMIAAGGKPEEIAERLYLAILSRFPTKADVKAAEEHAKTGVAKGNDVWVDLAWALVNSPEFLLRH